ncbi:MAG TPA: alkaline phosphatase family protein [Candidatus Sulfotelmatobacter sp.]|jgi:phospholipase C
MFGKTHRKILRKLPTLFIALTTLVCLQVSIALADGNVKKVNHIIIVMQENHSFDNYFGALAYAPGSPYHNGNGSCASSDHTCVDGLTCTLNGTTWNCTNSNLDDDGSTVNAFKATSRCVIPDLDHSWLGTHNEMNFESPNKTLTNPLSDGFVRQNDLTEQIDNGENPTDDQTISFYNQDDLPFYYGLAQNFAISDRQFAAVLGPTFPNRSYLMTATSFGHLTTDDTIPPIVGYKPITGTIFDKLDSHGISWADYFEDVTQDDSFRPFDLAHNLPLATFFLQAAGIGTLPQVSFVDPNFGTLGNALEDDEHPPTDIQRGQYHVSNVINAVRNGPFWKDSIIFVLYDEHGGFYDHAKPPRAPQNGARTPDGIFPGQCEDLSFPPFSEQPGGGAECSWNFVSTTDTTLLDAEALCPELTSDPTGPFPASCAAFDQLGVRVPLIAVSPFSKPSYVSHTVGDHTSLLALIEKRFLSSTTTVHLTKRDQYANDLEGMFDFDHSPSLNTAVGSAQPPQNDCTPAPTPGERKVR